MVPASCRDRAHGEAREGAAQEEYWVFIAVSHRTQGSISKIRGQVLKSLPQDRTASATLEELRDWEWINSSLKGVPQSRAGQAEQ